MLSSPSHIRAALNSRLFRCCQTINCNSRWTPLEEGGLVGHRLFSGPGAGGLSNLAELRKKTGLAFTLCKKALQENGNDLDQAEKWLKAEAKRNGWQKSIQLQHRRASEGLIGVHVQNNKSGVLLEVNCESDFVTRNQLFRELVAKLTLEISSATLVKPFTSIKLDSNPSLHSEVKINKYNLTSEHLTAFGETIATAVTQLGENIKVTRATLIDNPNPEQVKLMGYSHAVGGQPPLLDQVHLGKYATILAYRELPPLQQELSSSPSVDPRVPEPLESKSTPEKPEGCGCCEPGTQPQRTVAEGEEDEYATVEVEQSYDDIEQTTNEQVAKLLCQHIIGLKPKVVFKRKRQAEAEEGKTKEGEQEQEQAEDEESDALLEQKFLVNEKVSVKQFLADKRLQVIDFERYECGQNLENN